MFMSVLERCCRKVFFFLDLWVPTIFVLVGMFVTWLHSRRNDRE